jgi:hypothetical protein
VRAAPTDAVAVVIVAVLCSGSRCLEDVFDGSGQDHEGEMPTLFRIAKE